MILLLFYDTDICSLLLFTFYILRDLFCYGTTFVTFACPHSYLLHFHVTPTRCERSYLRFTFDYLIHLHYVTYVHGQFDVVGGVTLPILYVRFRIYVTDDFVRHSPRYCYDLPTTRCWYILISLKTVGGYVPHLGPTYAHHTPTLLRYVGFTTTFTIVPISVLGDFVTISRFLLRFAVTFVTLRVSLPCCVFFVLRLRCYDLRTLRLPLVARSLRFYVVVVPVPVVPHYTRIHTLTLRDSTLRNHTPALPLPFTIPVTLPGLPVSLHRLTHHTYLRYYLTRLFLRSTLLRCVAAHTRLRYTHSVRYDCCYLLLHGGVITTRLR